jgi:hypothetical protein
MLEFLQLYYNVAYDWYFATAAKAATATHSNSSMGVEDQDMGWLHLAFTRASTWSTCHLHVQKIREDKLLQLWQSACQTTQPAQQTRQQVAQFVGPACGVPQKIQLVLVSFAYLQRQAVGCICGIKTYGLKCLLYDFHMLLRELTGTPGSLFTLTSFTPAYLRPVQFYLTQKPDSKCLDAMHGALNEVIFHATKPDSDPHAVDLALWCELAKADPQWKYLPWRRLISLEGHPQQQQQDKLKALQLACCFLVPPIDRNARSNAKQTIQTSVFAALSAETAANLMRHFVKFLYGTVQGYKVYESWVAGCIRAYGIMPMIYLVAYLQVVSSSGHTFHGPLIRRAFQQHVTAQNRVFVDDLLKVVHKQLSQ